MYKETFNTKIYGKMLLRYFPDINQHDYLFLSNKLAKIYKDIDDLCKDNFTLCKSLDNGRPTPDYIEQSKNGCCGRYDKKLHNEVTGNIYYYGFNYGH